jgi:DNA processing protein
LFDGEPQPSPVERLGRGAEELERWRSQGIKVLTVLDPDYPLNLLAVHDRPAAIFIAGQLTADDQRAVAIIGSRRASSSGLSATDALAASLAAEGYTIVSGLAAGIDTAAHRAALRRGGRTLAVIGTGLNHSYPAENAWLQREIARTGAVISQFRPETRPSRETFPQRNAVMSGAALATVIVEAGVRSGARIQARRALQHGRPVFINEKLLEEPWARELSGRPGVTVYRDPKRVIEVLARLTDVSALTA